MEYKVEELSPVKKKINITVPAEEVGAALSATTALYRAKVDIKGFRKGKAPSSVIQGKYKDQIYQEASTDLINYHINQILSEIKANPVSRIDVDGDQNFTKDQDFEYSISFEIAPEIDLPEYKGVKIKQQKVDVTEEDIKGLEDRMLGNMATTKPIEDVRKPQDGDVVSVNFGIYQGETVLDGIQAENFELTLGQQQALPEFEELIKTLEPQESGEKEVTFPEDFINTNLAGKTATIKATVNSIKERILPEMNEETAKKTGFESVEQLREALEKSYRQGKENLAKSEAQKGLVDSLIKDMDFPLPPSMVEERIDLLVMEMRNKLERSGKSIESLGKSPEQIRGEFKDQAEEYVRTELFLLAVGAKEELVVQPQEIDGYLKKVSEQTGQSFFEIKQYYEDNNLLIPLKDRLLADKASDLIYDKAEIEYVENVEEEKKDEE